MNAFIRLAIAGFVVLWLPIAAQGGPLRLVFSAGDVAIDADAVPLRTILDEWAKLGGTRVDGLDRVPDAEITLHVSALPEEAALDLLLQGRNGYATIRRKPGDGGASQFARIAVFPSATLPATAGAPRSNVPADWPFPVNEQHPEDARQAPTAEIKIERPGIETPWPFPINEAPAVDTAVPPPPTLESVGIPGIDVPWPFPVNEQPTLDVGPPAAAVIEAIPGVDVPWPFPVNPNPVDPDAPPSDPPAPAAVPAMHDPKPPTASDKPVVEAPPSDPNKPATKAKGAPVSTKAPKPVPVPPRKRPQP